MDRQRYQSNKSSGSRRWKRGAGVAAMVSVMCLTGAACSSSSKGSAGASGTPTTSGSPTTSNSGTPSGAPITIGAIDTASGAVGIPEDATIASVWEKWTNAHGGINGHPVRLITLDDAGSPATALSEAKQLVEQDHVLAVVGSQSFVGQSAFGYLSQAHIPVLGGNLAANYGGGPYAFDDRTSVKPEAAATVQLIQHLGSMKAASLYCVESQACATFNAAFVQAGKTAGLTSAYAAAISATAPDYTGQCLALKSSGATAVVVLGTGPVALRVDNACREQGYTGAFVESGSEPSPSLNKQEPTLSGLYVTDQVWPFSAQDTAGQRAFNQAVDQYASGMFSSPSYGPNVQAAWAGFELFAAAAEAAHIGPDATRTDVLNGLYALPAGDTLDGIAPPFTYSRSDSTHFDNCYFVAELKSGQWIEPLGPTAQCVSNSAS